MAFPVGASPADTLGAFLEGAGVPSSPWAIKIGKQTSTPDCVIACYDTGGQSPNPRWAVDFVMVQALVRSGPNDYSGCWAKARQVRDTMLGLPSQDIAGDRWVSITCPGDVAFVGYDDKERPTCSINFRIIIEPANVGNREAL